ncbi:MAG: permease [Planctomycetota bacterium]
MTNLLLGLAVLFLGPLLVVAARRVRGTGPFIDAFVLVVLFGLVTLHILPHALVVVGWPGLGLAMLGFLAPLYAERALQGHEGGLRRLVVTFALIGLLVHAFSDGIGLSTGGHELHGEDGHEHGARELLAWAVILHRIPVGVSIWWIIPRTLGYGVAIATLLVTALGTVFGYGFGEALLDAGSGTAIAGFEAFLAGSLLHVVLHAHIPVPRMKREPSWHLASFGGALLAAAVVFVLAYNEGLLSPGEAGPDPGAAFVRLALESAPALVLAFTLVGLFQVLVPQRMLRRIGEGPPLMQAAKGVLFGLPLPICSCGVVPVYRSLVGRGASLAAATAFLIATPELEIAAVLLTLQLMGPELALVRIAAAATLALLVGVLLNRIIGRGGPPAEPTVEADEDEPRAPWLRVLTLGFREMVDHTAVWILLGLGVSALLMPHVDEGMIGGLPEFWQVPLAALLGLPLYVCASGSTPVAAVFLAQGLSPGSVLAFLLTGPATNVSTFGILARLHDRRTAAWFGILAFGLACAIGWVVDLVLPPLGAPPIVTAEDHGGSPLQWACLALLTGAFVLSLLRRGTRFVLSQLFLPPIRNEEDPCASGHDH